MSSGEDKKELPFREAQTSRLRGSPGHRTPWLFAPARERLPRSWTGGSAPRLSGGSHFLLTRWAPSMRAAAVCTYTPLCLSLANYLCLSLSLWFLHLSIFWPQGITQHVLMFVESINQSTCRLEDRVHELKHSECRCLL